MRIPKKYGSYKEVKCVICGMSGVTKNSQGLSVCVKHKNQKLQDRICVCGSWLELRVGKFGPYFNCIKCGNVNFNKVMASTPEPKRIEVKKTFQKTGPKEIFVTSDELDFL